jgi:hypothetical protein
MNFALCRSHTVPVRSKGQVRDLAAFPDREAARVNFLAHEWYRDVENLRGLGWRHVDISIAGRWQLRAAVRSIGSGHARLRGRFQRQL